MFIFASPHHPVLFKMQRVMGPRSPGTRLAGAAGRPFLRRAQDRVEHPVWHSDAVTAIGLFGLPGVGKRFFNTRLVSCCRLKGVIPGSYGIVPEPWDGNVRPLGANHANEGDLKNRRVVSGDSKPAEDRGLRKAKSAPPPASASTTSQGPSA